MWETSKCLGLEISQARPERKLYHNQSKYVKTILNGIQMAKNRLTDMPMEDCERAIAFALQKVLEEDNLLTMKQLKV